MPVKKTIMKNNPAPVTPRLSKKAPLQLLKGMKDILPKDQAYHQWLTDRWTKLASYYGFGRIDTPILESANLFVRSIGAATDIIEKEMYVFTDPGGEKVGLRPENTASIARAYLEHGMLNLPQPVKLYYAGPMFRHDKPQAGRYRQFHQFGLETFGEHNPAVDAEIIFLSYLFCKELGLDVTVQINSIGTVECRKEYIKQLVAYFRRHRRQLSVEDRNRLTKNPLRLLDSKTEGMAALLEEAPQIVDWLDEPSKNHFMKVLEYLDGFGVPYLLNQFLVRGLDYYTHTVFEIWAGEEEEGRQSALGGGGRYDNLVTQLGDRDVPGCGVSFGVERLVNELRRRGINPPKKKPPVVFLAQIGEQAKRKAFSLFEQLRKEKIPATQMFAKDSLKSQLELADKLGVSFVLILGQKEVMENSVLVRDMAGGVQETVDLNKIITVLKKKIKDAKQPLE